MAFVKIYNKTGDAQAQKVQAEIEKQFGFLPETFQAMGRTGAFLQAVLDLTAAAGKGLDGKTKELISLAVSAAVGCEYCVNAHRALAKKQGASEDEVTATLEVAGVATLYNVMNMATGLKHDIKAP